MENSIHTSDIHFELKNTDIAWGITTALAASVGLVGTGIFLGDAVADHFNSHAGALMATITTMMFACPTLVVAPIVCDAVSKLSALGAGRTRPKTEAEKRDSARSIPGRDLC